ncbi:MAG: N-acetylmuramoyl-L-alanine amidase [bacterium]
MHRCILLVLLLVSISAIGLSQPIEVNAAKPFLPEGNPLDGLVITLDPGHGGFSTQPGYTGSARGINSRLVEENLNMLVAIELYHYLDDAGAEVYLTRAEDRKITLGDTGRAEELGARVNRAMEKKSHLFLSLHHNSTSRKTADGVVVMLYPTDSKGNPQPLETTFADILKEEVEKQVHHAEEFKPLISDHPLVHGCDIPSVIIEFGFLSNPEFDAWVSQSGSHRAEALGAYHGIVRMWNEHRQELEVLRKKNFLELARLKSTKSINIAFNPQEEIEQKITELAHRLWPSKTPPRTASEAQSIIELFKRTVLTNRNFFYLSAQVSHDTKQGWLLRGRTNYPLLKSVIAKILAKTGCNPISNQIVILPSSKLGEYCYGIVQIPMAMTWTEPKELTSPMTQLLVGERLLLLDVTPDTTFYLVHGEDGYAGWVRADAVLPLTKPMFTEWALATCATFVHDYFQDELRFPTGANLPILQTIDTSSVLLRLPRGYRATIDKPEVLVPINVLRLPNNEHLGRMVATTAVEYLTVPYMLGGKSKLGIDCSGLNDIAYKTVGLTLPRDSWEQVIIGQLVATPWDRDRLEPGDMVFFCNDLGMIVHTGISLGGARFIHATSPEVQVSSFEPTDPLYDKDRVDHFAFGRRPLIEK